MLQSESKGFNWDAIHTGIVIVSGLIAVASGYLRMFIGNKMSVMDTKLTLMEAVIMGKIESKFSQKEIVELQIKEHDRRLLKIETKMENIRVQKEHDDGH